MYLSVKCNFFLFIYLDWMIMKNLSCTSGTEPFLSSLYLPSLGGEGNNLFKTESVQ